jgi:hypothetical protein
VALGASSRFADTDNSLLNSKANILSKSKASTTPPSSTDSSLSQTSE